MSLHRESPSHGIGDLLRWRVGVICGVRRPRWSGRHWCTRCAARRTPERGDRSNSWSSLRGSLARVAQARSTKSALVQKCPCATGKRLSHAQYKTSRRHKREDPRCGGEDSGNCRVRRNANASAAHSAVKDTGKNRSAGARVADRRDARHARHSGVRSGQQAIQEHVIPAGARRAPARWRRAGPGTRRSSRPGRPSDPPRRPRRCRHTRCGHSGPSTAAPPRP